jgi:signal transduction histidine kinase
MNSETIPPQGHILVVDDNRLNRLKLTRILEQQGHTVDLAEDGRQALARLTEQPAAKPYDVVLLDLIMPEMDGFAVLQAIRANANLRDMVVIVISALDEMESIVRCIEMGAEDYLPKPFDPVLLRARLTTSLEKKKLRDLERDYLQQEMRLRQSEKLATLGRLSAGIAHELNNPAAAAHRSAQNLLTAVDRLQQTQLQLDMYGLSQAQQAQLSDLLRRTATHVTQPLLLDALSRSDRQEEVERWLDLQAIADAWQYAPDLVALGYDLTALRRLAATFSKAQLPAVVAWISATFTLYSLAQEISDSSGRIAAIVQSLKSYTYMDQAPAQLVDIHEGLTNTLTMLAYKLKQGISVRREFAPDLPRIEGYGSELNQVWTNLIDNAAAAMSGRGELTLRTRREEAWVVIEVEDTGPGIPAAVQAKIFEPFFTTKPPGEGTGLGLNISHNIIVQKHGGQITVESRPGRTCFRIRLPINKNAAASHSLSRLT